jgi:formate hydrogenlyase subunit 3/multisubunit Na+/H+ antiporter MnhD subunit
MNAAVEINPNWNLIFGGLFIVLAAAIFLYARSIRQGGWAWWALAGLSLVSVITGTLIGEGFIATLLVDAAALCAVALVWVDENPKARQAARVYLGMVVPALAALVLAEILTEGPAPAVYPLNKLAAWLFLAGFVVKLALLPVYFWLPQVAESAAPMSVALIVGVVDIAAFRELAAVREHLPWVFSDHWGVWLAIALLCLFGGALLALGQKNIRRMLAFSTIDDLGYLLLGVLLGSQMGLTGAMLGAVAHALFKVILFGAVGVAEQGLGHPLTLEDHGLAGRFPLAGAAFIAAALGMVGVPPLVGFAGRWRLYLSGLELGGLGLGLVLAVSTVLALFYYVRAIHRVWMGPTMQKQKPNLASVVLVILAVIALILGLVPAWLLS